MQNFIPKQKLNKKAQRELNHAKRKTWGALNPTTKKPANPKAYNRRKVQKGDDYSILNLFVLLFYISLHYYVHRYGLNYI